MEKWTGEHHALAIKVYYKNDDNFAQAQRLSIRHFRIHRNNPAPSAQSINKWVQNFEETGSALLKKFPRRVKTVRTPWKLCFSERRFERSPRCAASLGISTVSFIRLTPGRRTVYSTQHALCPADRQYSTYRHLFTVEGKAHWGNNLISHKVAPKYYSICSSSALWLVITLAASNFNWRGGGDGWGEGTSFGKKYKYLWIRCRYS